MHGGVVGLSPDRGGASFQFINFRLFQKQLFTCSRNGCCCPRTVDISISYVTPYRLYIYIYIYIYIQGTPEVISGSSTGWKVAHVLLCGVCIYFWFRVNFMIRLNRSQIVDFPALITLKFDRRLKKIKGQLFYATSSFVHHFVAICEFKL